LQSIQSLDSLREKLQIKSEALNLLGKQLELCNKEKIEYKRLIDTLYDKNLTLKKTLYFKENDVDANDENIMHTTLTSSVSMTNSDISKKHTKLLTSSGIGARKLINKSASGLIAGNTLFNDIDSEDYMRILKDLIKTLQKEKSDITQKYEETKQELNDARSDLRLLREQLVRQRVGVYNEGLTTTIKPDLANPMLATSPTNSTPTSSNSSFQSVRESLIKEIELLKEQKLNMENELKMAQCQREEIEQERDAYKTKYTKLNRLLIQSTTTNLSAVNQSDLNNNNSNETGDKDEPTEAVMKAWFCGLAESPSALSRVGFNIDEVISQNKYLLESNKYLKEELEMVKSALKKYKYQLTTVNTGNQSIASSNSVLISDTGQVNKSQIKNLLKSSESFLSRINHQQQLQQQSHELDADDTASSDQIEKATALLSAASELVKELKLLAESLIENVNDKTTANSHQRKVNKMLANRIQDLEKEIETYFKKEKQPLKDLDDLMPSSVASADLTATLVPTIAVSSTVTFENQKQNITEKSILARDSFK
jgi:hypothetical protein